MGLMFQPFLKYVDFEGRARRSEYWLWCLFLFVVNAILTIVEMVVIGGMAASVAPTTGQGASEAAMMQMGGGVMVVNLIKLVFFLAILLPSIAVAVRRMHDTNRTGWWILFPSAVFLISAIIYFVVDGANFMKEMQALSGLDKTNSDPEAAFKTIAALLKALFWIFVPSFCAKLVTFVFRVMDGTPGQNRFGPDPKGRGKATASVF